MNIIYNNEYIELDDWKLNSHRSDWYYKKCKNNNLFFVSFFINEHQVVFGSSFYELEKLYKRIYNNYNDEHYLFYPDYLNIDQAKEHIDQFILKFNKLK